MSVIDNARALVASDDARLDRIRSAGFRTIGLMAPRHRVLRELIAEHERLAAQPTFQDAESLLNDWLLEEKGASHFDRGLHLLGHLARGGTIEQYGRPEGAGQ